MRIVVTGATGNVGTALLRSLAADERVEEIVGIARRLPDWQNPRTRWVRADVGRSITEVLGPTKLDYLVMGHLCPHVHCHVYPQYEDDDPHALRPARRPHYGNGRPGT